MNDASLENTVEVVAAFKELSGRNLVVCCDGSSNEFGDVNTNVVRLVQVLEQDPRTQLVYYDPGVGTLPEPGLFSRPAQVMSRWLGLGFGVGLLRNVEEAYSFLMDVWRPNDRVYLFGFSRGAYTVRILAGLLRQVGLLAAGQRQLVPYALRLYRATPDVTKRRKHSAYWRLCGQFRNTFGCPIPGQASRRFPVHFLGVWDTVSSVGWVWNPRHFAYTARNDSVATIRHAVSLDERRSFFRQNLFVPIEPDFSEDESDGAPAQDLQERWFAGGHCDIGGGYSDARGALWRVAFDWMVGEARAMGLRVDDGRLRRIRSQPRLAGEPWQERTNRSLTWKWWAAELWPKLSYSKRWKRRYPSAGLFGSRGTEGAVLHESVLQRLRADPRYRPRNIPSGVIDDVVALPEVPVGMTFAIRDGGAS
jgi:uncharacterized protein (DUF2235 family)